VRGVELRRVQKSTARLKARDWNMRRALLQVVIETKRGLVHHALAKLLILSLHGHSGGAVD
jgi:hypothetical protein